MSLSIIVPTYNSEKTLKSCLTGIRNSHDKDYEVIVVDDGSVDEGTSLIAKEYADNVIEHRDNLGRSHARNTGVKHTQGDILLFIDSDVVIRPDTITKIKDYFHSHPEIDAVSGLLSTEHPHQNFFSQYKNLYMNYIFSKLPERVNFLYGSCHAVRRDALVPYGTDVKIADDTELGQRLVRRGSQIAFLRDLDVVHLKEYSFKSFVINDFRIPFDWANIFIRYRGWKQLNQNKTGYLHSPQEQLVSVVLAPVILLLSLVSFVFHSVWIPTAMLGVLWYVLNHRFFVFMSKERGVTFGILSVFVTFFDHQVMALGIGAGLLAALFRKIRRWVRTIRRKS